MTSTKTFLILITIAAILLAACVSIGGQRTIQAHEIVAQKGYSLANVTDVEVQPSPPDPFRVDVWAQGPLPSRCVGIGQTFEDRIGNDVTIVLTTETKEFPGCDDGIAAEFVQISPLENLSPGIYTVTIHGITKTFEITANGLVQ